jgi:uncharacterized cofD-like protein
VKKIKAIIFDLDDTLYDCSGKLTEQARMRAAQAMIEAGLPLSLDEAYKKQIYYYDKFGPRCDVFNKIAVDSGIKNKDFVEMALKAYNSDDVSDIELFPDVIETLRKLRKKYTLILVTAGIYQRQKKKIEILGIGNEFDEIIINDIEKDPDKGVDFEKILKKYGYLPEEFAVVGDRISSEIRIGNRLGMNTIQLLHGKYKDMEPKNELEEPDYRIKEIGELPLLIKKMESHKEPKIVCIGGGTGLSRVLKGLKAYTSDITAIVTVTDAGRSSGVIREELNVLPPADIKNCLIALSERPEDVHNLLRYRFEGDGKLGDMSFGNLFIAALTKTTGSFEEAVKRAGEILHIKGRVLPVSLTMCNICAELEDGTICKTDYEIYKRTNKSRVKRVFIDPPCSASTNCLEEIEKADIVVIGPGSLYTSLLANLAMGGMKEALQKTGAKVVYVANLVTQKGQTEGFSLSDHIRELEKYIGKDVVDFVIVSDKEPDAETLKKCEGIEAVRNDVDEKKAYFKIMKSDVMEESDGRVDKGKHDPDVVRHNPDKVSKVLMSILNENGKK